MIQSLATLLALGMAILLGRRLYLGFRTGEMQMPVRLIEHDPYFFRSDEPHLFWLATLLNGFLAACMVAVVIIAAFRFVQS